MNSKFLSSLLLNLVKKVLILFGDQDSSIVIVNDGLAIDIGKQVPQIRPEQFVAIFN